VRVESELELGVVAEGVETTAQLEELMRLVCFYAQWFLFCHPTPGDEIPEAVAQILETFG